MFRGIPLRIAIQLIALCLLASTLGSCTGGEPMGSAVGSYSDVAILTDLRDGKSSLEESLKKLQHFPSETLSEACIDHHRSLRTGMPEVIYGASKTSKQIQTTLLFMADPSAADHRVTLPAVDPLAA